MMYPNAPITEAIFSIYFDNMDILQLKDLLLYRQYLFSNFPNRQLRSNVGITSEPKFNNSEKVEANKVVKDLIGYNYFTIDNTRVLSVGSNYLIYNVLKPYYTWEEHFNFFWSQLGFYYNVFRHQNVTRIGVRYINRIEIPLTFSGFQEYIKYMPPIPHVLPQTYAYFLMQLQIPVDGIRQAMLTETIAPFNPSISNTLPFILDIDVSQSGSFDLLKDFKELRTLKNSIFEDSITEKTRQLFL